MNLPASAVLSVRHLSANERISPEEGTFLVKQISCALHKLRAE